MEHPGPFHGKRSVGAADFRIAASMTRTSGKQKKKVPTDVGPAGQQDGQPEDQIESDEETLATSDQATAHDTMPEPNYEGLTTVELRSQLRSRNLPGIGNKVALVDRLQQVDVSEATVGHSAMMQDVQPGCLDAVAGSAEGEPTTVATIGDLPEVVGADTPGPVENTGNVEGETTTVETVDYLPVIADTDTPGTVENAPPGDEATVVGDDNNLLGVDVSAPPTAQGVSGEVDTQHGDVDEELVTVAVLKCGVREAGGERRKRCEHCHNAGRRAPTSTDRLTVDLAGLRVELRAELRAEFHV